MERRNLLRAAVAVPVLGGLPAAEASAGGFDPHDPRFAIAVLPDTQYLFDADSSDPAPLRESLGYLLEHRAADNIAFLAQLGDLTEHGVEAEFDLVGAEFRRIDGRLPYSVLAGNHDVVMATDDQRGPTAFLAAFGPARFAGSPTYLGASDDGYNSAHLITAGGRAWLILALDWRISDGGLGWARGILAKYPTVPAIVTTHDLVLAHDDGEAFLSRNGHRLWDQLINDSDQIFLTLNGHFWPPGRAVLTNAAGHDVHVHITNYQDRYYGGAAMIRLYRFDLGRNRIDVETLAPWLLARDPERRTPLEAETIELTSDVDRFSLEIDFAARFAGFAPPPLPAPRPAETVINRDTVAYWRFDGAGQSVADGATVPDRTGKGNDLSVRRLAHSGPETLMFSGDHHAAAPGQASLRFDGGRDPDRGAILQTGPRAPINGLTFLDGYTIEVFLKLPEPFDGDHAWMGVLSWEGRSGDAGKRSGWSPLEPTCSLNVTSERFLQYVVYSADGDHNPTSWSHALPTGVWQHVAIVNDGRRSIVWVNGSEIARNSTRPAHGIATVGRPFTLGATSFDLAYGQGFYGWLGDVRITGRPLRPAQFLPAGHYRP
ncbi:LamG-like jellyroll fold domain-containing protein [Paractinoplanes durhamensis]|uniref:Tat pathway signal sequence domain protein n=1 Tax=Paractinoplanes durhamensis TaxID=113563 RepID=A0ABQ3Z5X6_9ACTN|nr:LamG-like jellyroll fold domain-containing protein [Actinoplanes durhamensis]GIE05227.1 hypothetical protein Adu01nite_65770 [Actinoplanes durhamensis]